MAVYGVEAEERNTNGSIRAAEVEGIPRVNICCMIAQSASCFLFAARMAGDMSRLMGATDLAKTCLWCCVRWYL